MLSCSCGEWDGDGWTYTSYGDFSTLNTKRRRRCCSCKELIDVGSLCLEFERYRYPNNEIEIRIYGDDAAEVYLASWYMCENCSEIYLNLDALGYCLEINLNMNDYLKEYQEMTGFFK